jgi:uncharacterized lipoprotein YehR (DUF1307 family)
MKKSKLLALGLIAMVLAVGLALASCDNDEKESESESGSKAGCVGAGDCYYNSNPIMSGYNKTCSNNNCAPKKAQGSLAIVKCDC